MRGLWDGMGWIMKFFFFFGIRSSGSRENCVSRSGMEYRKKTSIQVARFYMHK